MRLMRYLKQAARFLMAFICWLPDKASIPKEGGLNHRSRMISVFPIGQPKVEYPARIVKDITCISWVKHGEKVAS